MPAASPGKVVLATFGTLGDIYPFVAIGRALQARGFAPVVAAPAMYRRAIEDEGLVFAGLRPDVGDLVEALGVDVPGVFRIMLKNPHFILDEIYMRFLSETYEDVMGVSAGVRVLITHSLLVGAQQAAETLGLPSARVALAPMHLQSAIAPSVTPPAPYILHPTSRVAIGYNRLVRATVRLSVHARLRRLRSFRRSNGLPRTGEDFFLDFGRANRAHAVFGLYSPRFAPPQPDQPANLSVPGFPFYAPADPVRRELPSALRSFLSAGPPPVVFTLGSFAPEVAGDFYARSRLASRALGLRAVLLVGKAGLDGAAALAGPDSLVCAQAPHGLLFPHGLCIVHHGGIGTTAEALRAGKPQIVVPFFGDQPDHGARVERLGIGIRLDLSAYDTHTASAALRTLLAGAYRERAESVGRAIAGEKGVAAVADWVESLAGGPAPVPGRST